MITAAVAFVLGLLAISVPVAPVDAPHADYRVELNRVRYELPAVSYSAELSRLAQMRADDLAREQPTRLHHAGAFAGTAENLWRSNWAPEPWQVMEDWLASPSHTTILLLADVRAAGWGFAQDTRGFWYVVLLLGYR